MFSNLMIGVFFGLGSGAWVYAKLQRYNGGNTQSSAIGGATAGLIGCFVVVTLLSLVFKN